MKRSILISVLLVVLLMATSILAQETVTRPVKYGIKAGVGFANITGGDKDVQLTDSGAVVSPSMKIGVNFGLWLRYNVSPNFAVQPEVLYVMKGAKYEDGADNVKYKFNYIQVPVLFKYMFPGQSKMAPSIFAGPFLGFLASAKAKGEIDGIAGDADVKDFFKSTEFGVSFGAGLDFASGESGVFTVDARYDLGLSKIPKKDDVSGETANIKTSNIAVFLGYGF